MHQLFHSITTVSEVIKADPLITDPKATIRSISFDSRKLTDMPHTLFFALKGRRDGHGFVKEVYAQGVRNFVITDKSIITTELKDANFLLVKDVLVSLQALTAWHRKQFALPVIGITGSNGKTIVKEWLYQLLAPEQNIVRSPKSYNSQIGVPLSVWEINGENTMAIFEAGVSRAGEMNKLASVIRPTIGILTNVGEAHNEGFSSKEEKINEKLLLFSDVDLLIYNPGYLRTYTGEIPGKNKFTWAWNENADLTLIDDEILDDKYMFIRGRFKQKDVQCAIPFTDAASVENAICCWATMLALGYDPEVADIRLEKLQPARMRLELKTGINNCSLIDDSYSSDISSLAIALDFLKQQNQHHRRVVILSDIPEAGPDTDALYRQVAQLLENKNVDKLIGVGPEIGRHAAKFSTETIFFDDTDSLIRNLPSLKLYNDTILLKGARSFLFEQVSKLLTQKVHETVLEINLNAVEYNLNYYKSCLKPGVKIMSMVKAFSYGSGSFEIANLLQFNKVDYLAVAYADEGVTLRKSGISLPIMVMNADTLAFDTMIEHRLEPEIFSLRTLREFTAALQRKNLTEYPVHIKLDTGMHRLGFMPSEIAQLLPELAANKSIKVQSAFSHMVASEDPASDDFSRQQISIFRSATTEIENTLGYPFIKHLCNTSAISRWPEAQFDMVRLGIGLYGFDSTSKGKTSPLQNVTVLKTSISQIKVLPPGETVGYNRKGTLPDGGKIATVKIGYADGYNRKLGNGNGRMLLNGTLVPTIGNICMDMCMLDISGVSASEGDEVIVFNEFIKVDDIAAALNTIPYEVITSVSERVKRIYFYE